MEVAGVGVDESGLRVVKLESCKANVEVLSEKAGLRI